MTRRLFTLLLAVALASLSLQAGALPARAKTGMVISASDIASEVGWQVIKGGGNAVDAAVATAFALAVTHPTAGNIGGGGFMVYRAGSGQATSFDFREAAPAGANAEMWLTNGKYDFELHHNSHRSVGVPGTVAGLHMAWKELGSKPWKELVFPAVKLARDGFEISHALARSLEGMLKDADDFRKYPASVAQFSKNGTPYQAGEILKQPDLARTLERIADQGPAGFYEGETAALIEKEMKAHDGLITRDDLKKYQPKKREVIKGNYRGYELIGMPPPSSGGIAVVEALNILEGYDLKANGYGSAKNVHLIAESMRRAFADRAQYLGDPDFVTNMPIPRLISKEYGETLRKTINPNKASKSSPSTFTWPTESQETTHFSVVDAQRNAVSMTYTLEYGYGSRIVVPGAGFLLNNEMGDFNAGPGLTNEQGLIGTPPNLAQVGKRMLSSMAPTIVAKDGQLFMVTGSPGGRTIINTVLMTLLNVIDFGMNAQEAVDAGRIHHQWLPDRLSVERYGFSADTINQLKAMGHNVAEVGGQGVDEVIVLNPKDGMLEGGVDKRQADGGAAGK
ncbi:MAG TPA: gamma-glutamyltransferase [Vicinamibacterales bacterium]|nr:gamma-glutamyltransferase [Vicinamibacterales bacterium]